MSSVSWQKTSDPIWQRPLGTLELIFAIDGLHLGVSKCHNSVTALVGDPAHLSPERVQRAWAMTTRVHPLLAATITLEKDQLSGVFTLDERRLSGSAEDVIFIERKSDVPHLLGEADTLLPIDQHISRLVVEHHDARSATCYFLTSHAIGDGIARLAAMRTFFECLDSGNVDEAAWDIETQLKRVPAADTAFRCKSMSIARQRWRLATAKIIIQKRAQRITGGKTLPRLRIPKSKDIPVSAWIPRRFSASESQAMLAFVKGTGIRFHHHFSTCVQLALVRTLYKLQAGDKLFGTEEEWQEYLREPMNTGSPLNLRPFIGYEPATVALAICFFNPSFPPIVAKGQGQAIPTHEKLCSRERYLGRVKISERELTKLLTHPLFEDFNLAFYDVYMRSRPAFKGLAPPVAMRPGRDQPGRVMAFGGGSLGRLDDLLPANYPNGLKLRQDETFVHLRTRPGELYVGSLFWQEELYVFGAVDVATYDREVVELFFDEIMEAMRHHLRPGQ